jgi:flavodoxin
MSPRNLIVFYSMTGNTRGLADELRDALPGELEEILEPRTRKGLPGAVRALFDALTRREPPIRPPASDPAHCALLVLGGPVWAGRMAAPVRSYARRHGARANQVAFFCTQGGNESGPAFAELAVLCGKTPVATLAIPAPRLARGAHAEELRRFVASLAPAPSTEEAA